MTIYVTKAIIVDFESTTPCGLVAHVDVQAAIRAW
jgi:hypothetical protein